MGPVAQKLVKELRKARKGNVIDLGAVREARELSAKLTSEVSERAKAAPPGVPPEVLAWLDVLSVVLRLAQPLLGTQALRKLKDRVAAADDEYQPGEGPPMSPLLESTFSMWWSADLTVGARQETILSILADVSAPLGLPQGVRELASSLNATHFGVYRAKRLSPQRVSLTDIVTAEETFCELSEDCGREEGIWLARPFPPLRPGADGALVATPYLLIDPDAEQAFRDYFARVLNGVKPADRPTALRRHLKGAGDARRWLEYITDGYACVGQFGAICLTGVPDRPETLPHSRNNPNADALFEAPFEAPLQHSSPTQHENPLLALKARMLRIAEEGECMDLANVRADGSRTVLGAPERPLNPELDHTFRQAYAIYGVFDQTGASLLETIAESKSELPAEERQVLAELQAGWCSAFEVRHIRVDDGFEVLDALRRKKLYISDRSASRQLQLGDILYGWLLVDDDRVTLEGAAMRVPGPVAGDFVHKLKLVRDTLKSRLAQYNWKQRLTQLPPFALAIFDDLMANAPKPRMVNNDGHDILLSTAHYDILNRKKTEHLMTALYEKLGATEFVHLVDDKQHAMFYISGKELRIECNSQERLEAEKSKLGPIAKGLLRHRIDTHEDPMSAAHEASDQPDAQYQAPAELPPGATQALHGFMLQHMEKWADEPVPILDNKTPRQAVKNARGRETVMVLLAQQQQDFQSNPQTAMLDLSPIYKRLGLTPPG